MEVERDSVSKLRKFRSERCRKKLEVRKIIFVVLFLVYIGVTCVSLVFKSDFLQEKFDIRSGRSTGRVDKEQGLQRHKRDVSSLGEGKFFLLLVYMYLQ